MAIVQAPKGSSSDPANRAYRSVVGPSAGRYAPGKPNFLRRARFSKRVRCKLDAFRVMKCRKIKALAENTAAEAVFVCSVKVKTPPRNWDFAWSIPIL